MSDKVTLTLAHPLTSAQAERLRAHDVKEYVQGDSITLSRDDARSLINAGYAAGIEPSNNEQVRAALDGGAKAKAKTTASAPKAAS